MKTRFRTSVYIIFFYLVLVVASFFVKTEIYETNLASTLIFIGISLALISISSMALNEVLLMGRINLKSKMYWIVQLFFIGILATNTYVDFFIRADKWVNINAITYAIEAFFYLCFCVISFYWYKKYNFPYSIIIIATILLLGFMSLLYIFFSSPTIIDWSYALYVILIPVLTDTFAFLIGSKWGKNKVLGKISPKKTWEGAIGGLVITNIVILILYFLKIWLANYSGSHNLNFGLNNSFLGIYNLSYAHADLGNVFIGAFICIVFTSLLSIFSQAGDFLFSWVKRVHEKKDFANYLPGHGGICDRIDSLMLTSIIAGIIISIIS